MILYAILEHLCPYLYYFQPFYYTFYVCDQLTKNTYYIYMPNITIQATTLFIATTIKIKCLAIRYKSKNFYLSSMQFFICWAALNRNHLLY